MDTTKDNLQVLSELSKRFWEMDPDDQEDTNAQARLISIGCAAVEKLVLLNIFARNPILLMPESKISKEMFLKELSYETFDENWLFNQSTYFVKVGEQWALLDKLFNSEDLDPIGEFGAEFEYVKGVRNKYLRVIDELSKWRRMLLLLRKIVRLNRS